VKLLLDENLSPRLADLLRDVFPDLWHVQSVGLQDHPDQEIWEYARDRGMMILSKDNDFRQLSFLHGPPPKVAWLAVGNAGTPVIAAFIRAQSKVIRDFSASEDEGLLVLELFPRHD
jgi:predicted nuclease of predicted toxin-antitoxin system